MNDQPQPNTENSTALTDIIQSYLAALQIEFERYYDHDNFVMLTTKPGTPTVKPTPRHLSSIFKEFDNARDRLKIQYTQQPPATVSTPDENRAPEDLLVIKLLHR